MKKAGCKYRPNQGWVEALSLHEAQAEQFVCSCPPVKLARDCGQRRVHAVLFGLDNAVMATAEQIMLNASFPPPTFARPRLTFLVDEVAPARAAWEARYPAVPQWVTVNFLQFPPTGALRADAVRFSRLSRCSTRLPSTSSAETPRVPCPPA